MVLCPVANSVGCHQCGIVKVCLLRGVLGNYNEEEQEAEKTHTEEKSE